MTNTRSRFARLSALAAAVGLVLSLGATSAGATTRGPVSDGASSATAATGVTLAQVVTGLTRPVFVTSAGDGSGRLFVVEQGGKIRIVKNGVLDPTPFLDISDVVSKGNEQGLLGLAFHPSYATNGKFYVNFTKLNGDTAINEYRVSSDPDVAARSTGRRIMTIAQPYSNHNGGGIAFGPDHFLYIGMGDGGSAGDPQNRAQDVNSLLGKMLRIDINGTSSGRQYRIPASNPYVGRTGRDEIYSRGLRNPWRWSFDRVSGDLWIGDVGQNRYEEIDRSTTTTGRGRGVNYGWRVMEGRHCYIPATGCSTTGKTLPVVEYSHSQGCAVTGGYVYHGTDVPALLNRYVFADFCSGLMWTISRGVRAPATKTLLMDLDFPVSSFGEDEAGELYVVDLNGTLYKFEGP